MKRVRECVLSRVLLKCLKYLSSLFGLESYVKRSSKKAIARWHSFLLAPSLPPSPLCTPCSSLFCTHACACARTHIHTHTQSQSHRHTTRHTLDHTLTHMPDASTSIRLRSRILQPRIRRSPRLLQFRSRTLALGLLPPPQEARRPSWARRAWACTQRPTRCALE